MTRLSALKKDERDRLVQQILNAARMLYDFKLLRNCDLVVDQDDLGPSEARTGKPTDNMFYSQNKSCDVRISVTLVVRAVDR
jgi:hypothetical protein